MTDFVTQASIDAGLVLPQDGLGHERAAELVFEKVANLEPGSVIAIQGGWGRGKTDVLARVAHLAREDCRAEQPKIADVIWVNPWQYGTPDLLTPLTLSVIGRIGVDQRAKSPGLRRATETILRAGINFGLKAVGATVPGGGLLSIAAEPVDKIVGALFDAQHKATEQDDSSQPDPDPVAVMGERFRTLVQELLKARPNTTDRMLVCVDDLDRCLPDRQVALLEAIRFLTSAHAAATFVVAIDSTLAKQAVFSHYQTEAFDADRYLDKMFDLRVNLPAISTKELKKLLEHHLQKSVELVGGTGTLRDALAPLFGKHPRNMLSYADKALFVPDLRNPRIVGRMFDRMRWCATLHPPSDPIAEKGTACRLFLLWLGMMERWPSIREVLQDAGPEIRRRFDELTEYYAADSPAKPRAAVIDRLPDASQAPELREIFTSLCSGDDLDAQTRENIPQLFLEFDRVFRDAGL